METERDALAAKYFPVEWARFANKEGASKQRQKLRKAAEDALKIDGLKASGASCATCSSYDTKVVFGLKGPHCSYHSDFHGYVMPKPDDLCLHWSAKP